MGFLLLETYCEDYGIVVAIEPLNVVECNLLHTLLEGYWLACETDRPHIRLLADYYHVQRNQENLIDLVSVSSRLEHVHLANCLDRGYPREETRADWLRKRGYRRSDPPGV